MRIERIFVKGHGTKLFSTLDIRSGYYNITVAENGKRYTTSITGYSKCEFFQIPFGIHITPSYFALMTNETLNGLDLFFSYTDNIKIFSKITNETFRPPPPSL